MERSSECEESMKVRLLLMEEDYPLGGPTRLRYRGRSWALPFQAFFRFCVVSRLPGDPWGHYCSRSRALLQQCLETNR